MSFLVVPDLHLGLQRSYIDFDYAEYIFKFFKDLVINKYPKHKIILLGDLKENAGVRSKFELFENELFLDLQSKNRLFIVKGNGKHCYDTIKHGKTFESEFGVDYDEINIDNIRIGLLGYQSDQEVLNNLLKQIDVDILCTHNFVEYFKYDTFIPEDFNGAQLILAGHNHKQSDSGDRVCLGSLVNTDFNSANDFAWVYDSDIDDIVKIPRYKFVTYTDANVEPEVGVVSRLVVPNNTEIKFKHLYNDIKLVDSETITEDTNVSINENIESMWSKFAADNKDIQEKGLEVLNACK